MAASVELPLGNSVSDSAKYRSASLQDREVHRYYQPWLSAHGSSQSLANHITTPAAKLDHVNAGNKPRASRDKALTAFAQLAAIRLDVKRGMVSLLDNESQYILAEATYSTSVRDIDDLWLGSTILAKKDGICEWCMNSTYTTSDEPGQPTLTTSGMVVNDCREDDRFRDRPNVTSEPGVRFFAGVPIVSRSGVVIGVYAASDESPRNGLSADELRFMHETAQAVMEHLEWARDRVDRFRGERMVHGMASFLEGCSSLHSGFDSRESQEEGPQSATPASDRHSAQEARSVDNASRNKRLDSASGSRSPRSKRRRPAASPRTRSARIDNMANMYARAAEILRESTIADGVAIFGASAGSSSLEPFASATSLSGPPSPSPGNESSPDPNTSDSDGSPQGRPCRILAYSLANQRAKADIEQGSALTLRTLEKYFQLHPRGRVFYFTETGSGISSDEEGSTSEQDVSRGRINRRKKTRMDHKELLKKIPGAQSVAFLPLYDFAEERLLAGCFLWTSETGRMMDLGSDLTYLRAFGNSIMSEVARLNVSRNEAAKTTFIASMSHELRSPLHGILGAAEFLADTATDSFQAGLITSIATCGKTLLDTLNHVLDYSKINKLGRTQMRRNARQNKLVNLTSDSSLESINMTAEVDLAVLVEEVVEAVTAGHAFKNLQGSGMTASIGSGTAIGIANDTPEADEKGPVSVLLDISPRQSWIVRAQPGALRRIIMNLMGNGMKYTSSGFVAVSLRAKDIPGSSKVEALIRVVDSGKGMSEEFQRNKLFVPFSQEDSFQPGTGLGLSIVKQITDSLGGSIDVKSDQDVGTEIQVHLSLTASEPASRVGLPKDDSMSDLIRQTAGMRLVMLDPCTGDGPKKDVTQPFVRLEQSIAEVCSVWLRMKVSEADTMHAGDADLYLYSEPPPVEQLLEHQKAGRLRSSKGNEIPIIIICMNADTAIEVNKHQSKALEELGSIVEVVAQPCGPRKLAKVLRLLLRRVEELRSNENDGRQPETNGADSTHQDQSQEKCGSADADMDEQLAHMGPLNSRLLSHEDDAQRKSPASAPDAPLSAAVTFPSPPPLHPGTPSLNEGPQIGDSEVKQSLNVLVVDDNRINIQLLTMFMKKHSFAYQEAENGQEAVDRYKESCLPGSQTNSRPPRRFDYVLMDLSMPVMDGLEATRQIRAFEKENRLEGSGIIALTGLATDEAQRRAQTAGVDVFLPKPVKFADLKKLLAQK
ncbi:hypothetical protein BAUCODRAFT_64163 [Baudoinia panamericana UAMH 10762]|uniref:histidine kinase n=1 Tax=Baudoinia panamericana (strain UAMH 10762) TaxID=717646 RepID=M2LZN0_BAUPA|nr:uncharacterized protein BAUCODRAFT_64163 [Baudoinia panamericana UAMH 10762]EMD00158.1 hypothetical protein BAUCODRAFT_64163 [Baudoinia panamericana UAMH 10762]